MKQLITGSDNHSVDTVTLPSGETLTVDCNVYNIDQFLVSKIPSSIGGAGWGGDGMAWLYNSGTTGDGNTLINGLMYGRENSSPLKSIMKHKLQEYGSGRLDLESVTGSGLDTTYGTVPDEDNPAYPWYKLFIDAGIEVYDTQWATTLFEWKDYVDKYLEDRPQLDPEWIWGEPEDSLFLNELYAIEEIINVGYVTGWPTFPSDMGFDVQCSVKLDGQDVPFSYVVGDAESNGTVAAGQDLESSAGDIANPDVDSAYYNQKEWFDLTAVNANNPTWRVLEQWSGCGASSSVTHISDDTVRMHSDERECNASGGKGPASVLAVDGLGTEGNIHVKLHTRGNSDSSATAISVGVLVAADFGDAPVSYGGAGAIWKPTWQNGDIPAGTSKISAITGEVQEPKGTTVTGYSVGAEPDDDYYLGAKRDLDFFKGNTMDVTASGDEADADAYPGDDEDAFTNGKNITNDIKFADGVYTYEIDVACQASTPVEVHGWIDWDNSGTFDESGYEHASGTCSGGKTTLKWEIPEGNIDPNSNVANGFSFMRLRINADSAHAAHPSGTYISQGEVEDYRVKWDTVIDLDKSLKVGKTRNGTDIADFNTDFIPGTFAKWDVAFTNTGDISYSNNYPAVIWDDLSNVVDNADVLTDTIGVFDDNGTRIGGTAEYSSDITFKADVDGSGAPVMCEGVAGVKSGTFYAGETPLNDSCSIGKDSGITHVIVWKGPLEAGKTYHLTYITELTTWGSDGELKNLARPANAPGQTGSASVLMPKLEVTKTAVSSGDLNNIKLGDSITYTVTVKNTGPGDVRYNANVVDDLSDVLDDADWVTFAQTASRGSAEVNLSAKTITWSPSSSRPLTAGQSDTFKYTVKYARANSGGNKTLTNQVSVPEEYGGGKATTTHTIKSPKLAVNKEYKSGTVKKGNTISYTITVKNTGDGDANNVVVDDIPGDAFDADTISYPSVSQGYANDSAWVVGTLQPGAQASATVTMKLNSNFDVTTQKAINYAVASSSELDAPAGRGMYDEETNPTGIKPNDSVDTDDDQGDYVVLEATELKIDKALVSDAPKNVKIGDELTYKITVKNTGLASDTGVEVTDTPGAGLQITSITPDTAKGTVNGSVWTIGDMAAGEVLTAP